MPHIPNRTTVPTVRVISADSPLGYVIINAADFVEGSHARFDESAQSASSLATAKRGKKAGAVDIIPPVDSAA